MEILQTIHGHTRWLVVLAVVVAALYMLYGGATRRSYDMLAYRIMLGFSTIIGIQWILGLLTFLLYTGLEGGYRWEHAITNTIALAVAHAHFSMKRKIGTEAADSKLYWRALLIIGLTMGIIFLGVGRLPYNAWAM